MDYIRKFIEDHKVDIDKRVTELAARHAKDAFLLILSPSKAVDFYKLNGARDELFKLIAAYGTETRKFSDEYYKVLNYYSLANYPTNNFTFRKVLYHEAVRRDDLLTLLTLCFSEGKPLSAIDDKHIKNAIDKAEKVRDILDSETTVNKKVETLAEHIQIRNLNLLRQDLERDAKRIEAIEHQDEEEAELEEIQVRQMSAVELLTIVSSKGLSADHVIIIGFDNINMNWITRNAFFVAKTRARRSLHIVTALKAGGAVRPHAFLDHLPDGHLEFSKYMKGERKRVAFPGRNEFLRYLKNLNAQGRRR